MTWPTVSLGDVCEFKYGRSLPAAKRVPGEVPVFGSNGVVGSHDKTLTDGPTIVIGRKGSFGEINYCSTGCWPIDTTYFVDAKATEAHLRWLSHLLPTLGLTKLNRAAAVPGLNREDAYRQTLLLPPLDEQRRIAAILDQADALRVKRRQALAHLDDLTQSIFLDMFGDRAWATRLDELAKVQIGPFGSLLHKDDYVSDGVALINPMHITDGRLSPDPTFSVSDDKAQELSRYRLQAGDLVLGRRGEMGRCGEALPEHAGLICGTGSVIIRPRPSRARSRFLHAVLRQSRMKAYLERQALGATLPNLNATIVTAAPMPSVDVSDQLEFEARLETANQTVRPGQAAQGALDDLFVSLQSRAFSGQL